MCLQLNQSETFLGAVMVQFPCRFGCYSWYLVVRLEFVGTGAWSRLDQPRAVSDLATQRPKSLGQMKILCASTALRHAIWRL